MKDSQSNVKETYNYHSVVFDKFLTIFVKRFGYRPIQNEMYHHSVPFSGFPVLVKTDI